MGGGGHSEPTTLSRQVRAKQVSGAGGNSPTAGTAEAPAGFLAGDLQAHGLHACPFVSCPLPALSSS